MDTNEAIANRRAVREYTNQPVDEPTIRHLIDAAILAPSAFNEQPWAFTVVRGQKVLDQISRDAKTHMLATMAPSPADRLRTELESPDFQIFHHAPVLIVISAVAKGPFIVEDCALAAENLMLAARVINLGSCWIGLAQGFLNTAAGKKALGCPDAWIAVAPIIVGHPTSMPPPVPRKAPDIHWIG